MNINGLNSSSSDKIINDIETEYQRSGNLKGFKVSVVQGKDTILNVDNLHLNMQQTFFLTKRLLVDFRDKIEVLQIVFSKIEKCTENQKFRNSEEWTQLRSALTSKVKFFDNLTKGRSLLKKNLEKLTLLKEVKSEKGKETYQAHYKKLQEDKKILENYSEHNGEEIYKVRASQEKLHPALVEDLIKFLPPEERIKLYPEHIENLLEQPEPNMLKADKLHGRNALHYAAGIGDVGTINKIQLILGENLRNFIDTKDKQQLTPLVCAIMKGNFEFAEKLIQLGANINEGNTSMLYPSLTAAIVYRPKIEIINFCLSQKSIDVLSGDAYERTALHHAVLEGNIEAVKILLKNKIVKNHLDDTDIYGDTARDLAVQEKKDDIIKLFPGKEPLDVTKLPGYGKKKVDIRQGKILGKLMRYLEIHQRDQSVLQFGTGHCNGFAFLAQYYLAQGKEEEFLRVLELIATWDGKEETLSNMESVKGLSGSYRNLGHLIEQWINDLVWFQHSLDIFEIPESSSAMGIKGRNQKKRIKQFETVKKPGTKSHIQTIMPFTCYSLTLQQLTELLKIWSMRPNTILDIAGAKHGTSARILSDGKIKYYDPNHMYHTKVFDSAKELAATIQKTKYQMLGKRHKTMGLDLMTYQYVKPNQKFAEPPSTESILDSFGNFNKISPNGFTLFHIAILLNQPSLVKTLLEENKIDVNAPDKHDTTPLQMAIRMGLNPFVAQLIQVADINQNGPIFDAIECKNIEALTMLLESSTQQLDLKVKNVLGDRPLDVAIKTGDPIIIQLLLDYGADMTLINDFLETPIEMVIETGNVKLIELFINHMKDVNQKDANKNTFLHYAVKKDLPEIVEILLKKGATEGLQPARELAKVKGNQRIIQLLSS